MPAASSSLTDPAIGQLLAAAQALAQSGRGCWRCWLRSPTRGHAAASVISWP
jgi:hypothetical protein